MDLVKTNCINDVVIIDGLSRSGKFYLGKLIACIEGMEYFINSAEFERILALNIAGTLSDANASSILVIAINEAIYNMAIGRNLNMREEDSSSILNSFESELYLNRVGNSNVGSNALKKVVDQGRLSVFITHMALMSLDMVKKAVPKSKIINIRRHPIDLAYSWIKRGWGSRYEEDPLSFDPIYCSDIGIVPYFAVGWAEEYLVVNEHDRVVKSIVFLTEKENYIIENSEHSIECTYYDNLLDRPHEEVNKICSFLNKTPHKSMLETIKKESRDIDFKSQREMKINYIRAGIKDKVFFDKLLDLGVKYEKNISNKDID